MKRKDGWNVDDDNLLASTVLMYIESGKTQLKAFEDVGLKLSRTSAACGFRWNSTVRHRYIKSIAEAKTHKIKRNYKKTYSNEELSIDSIISCLLALKDDLQRAEIEKSIISKKIQNVSLEINARRSERHLDALANKEALSLLLSKAAELGLFEHNKKPAI
ncbi:RsfA family transcriptional regulator [Paenibacillus barcinonensis]|uniref:RsfA family transcription factor n=1 Tax=Paenibacillus barcinonensis TaxID=198119 RepID=A0A2V4VDB5_PAEBA|nr:RsfA family transcriptional regulator [Paenibacillus barcinonensis]PYE51572.1 RsfA family transcription factor [Paenibacillus barcinonensis]QKS55941.1 RsfA family transcriptional regulator [Paenibacillus barcinonensis]